MKSKSHQKPKLRITQKTLEVFRTIIQYTESYTSSPEKCPPLSYTDSQASISKTSTVVRANILIWRDMGVSKNRGTPKSSILIGFSITNHPFWGTRIFGNIHIVIEKVPSEKSDVVWGMEHLQQDISKPRFTYQEALPWPRRHLPCWKSWNPPAAWVVCTITRSQDMELSWWNYIKLVNI